MKQRDHIPLVADMVKECESFRDELSTDRIKAIEYYDGVMNDTPSDKGRSSVVERVVRSTVQKVLPSLSRTFLASSQIVEYQPAQPGDEEAASQATDYMNEVVFIECDGPQLIEDAIHDSLKTRNAIIKWWYEEKKTAKVSRHTGLDENSFSQMVAQEGVEVLEHTARVETVEGVGAPVHDFKIKQVATERRPMVKCIPLEEFLIHPDAMNEDDAVCIGSKCRLRRSDLVAMGYDKDMVDGLPATGTDTAVEDSERTERRDTVEAGRNQVPRELEEVDYYEMFVRIDEDGDGIAELRRMCFGGKISENTLLDDEEADEIPFAIIRAKSKPHQWEGVAIADDTMDIQRLKTVLLRGTMDNLYWQNNQQIAVRSDLIEEESVTAVTNPQFGQGIMLKPGATVQEALQPILVPFVADKSFGMLEYMDREVQDRTGVSDASGGLPPDALQNVTAKASAMLEQQGIGQAELMARTLAHGFRRMFRGLLRLIVKHQDKPRTIRLRNKWVEFDPRQWNADMDCTVNTGLGAGTRERDLMVMTQVLQAHEKVLGAYGPTNPFVTPENFANALFEFAEAAGLRTPDLYFTKPEKEQIDAMLEGIRNKPDPEMQKLQAQAQLEMQKMQMQVQADMQMKQIDVDAAKSKEFTQSQAAVLEAVERAKIEQAGQYQDRALKKYEIDTKAQLELLKMNQQQQFERESAKEGREHEARTKGLEIDQDGKPYDKANKALSEMMQAFMMQMQAMQEESRKPKVVTTPDGETFTMGTLN